MSANAMRTLAWLQARGWTHAPPTDRPGDPAVIDPTTHQEVSLYEAAKRQQERTGEYPDWLRATP